MKSGTIRCLDSTSFHRMRYLDWGDPGAPRVVICVHGLMRTGRDFDTLAQALIPDFRVVCPDVAGRGQSDWLAKKSDYGYPQYMADMAALIARVTAGHAASVSWVGTSMGGIIGMLLASLPGTPIRRLVVNDVSALIPKSALDRIGRYADKDPRFPTFDELEAYIRMISAPFGPLNDAQWRHLTVHVAKQLPDGSWGLCRDPDIALAFKNQTFQEVDLWRYWDAITCPTLLLRGAESDLLPKETALAMTRRGPRARLVEFPGIGHAPTLMAADQIAVVKAFLEEEPPQGSGMEQDKDQHQDSNRQD